MIKNSLETHQGNQLHKTWNILFGFRGFSFVGTGYTAQVRRSKQRI